MHLREECSIHALRCRLARFHIAAASVPAKHRPIYHLQIGSPAATAAADDDEFMAGMSTTYAPPRLQRQILCHAPLPLPLPLPLYQT